MTVQFNPAESDLFEQLAARTFYVVDTEFCTHSSEHHLISIAVVPVVGGRRARAGDELYLEMNPGVPIDAATSAIHGFTDASVARKKSFAYYARTIVTRLNEPDAIFVCHNTIDAHVLRTELARLDHRAANGEPGITVGLADLPELPVLDTQRIAQAVSYPNAPRSARISLDRLCDLTGVSRTKKAHNARNDARAAANALITVLRYAAQQSLYWTYESFHEMADGGTTRTPKGPAHIRPRDFKQPPPPPEHVARHIYPLSDPVRAGSDAAEAWLTMAAECAALRCPYLRDEAAVAAEANGAILLKPLMEELPHLTEPGQAGTLLGAVHELLTGALNTLPARRALPWWIHAKNAVRTSPACTRENSNGLCPSCQDGDPCPRDIIYLSVAERATLGMGGKLTSQRVRKLLDPSAKGPVNTWRKHQPEILAYMLWRVQQHQTEEGDESTAGKALELAIAFNLHTIEPRLTELACQAFVDDGDPDTAFTVAQAVLDQRTSDTAYSDLSDWLHYTRHVLYAQQPPPRRSITYPRMARPEGRANPRRYS